ncbi:hypothetical protein B0H14DRAFT_2619651 [Mycena olivaceomarginata]|nr:hypothetical protein B0H14DRAFT_2619651 [Mycena olivaceomarginata]
MVVVLDVLLVIVEFIGRKSGRLDLFGECDPLKPPYEPMELLLGRSALRPLVRGEWSTIRFFRASILAFLCLAIPAFGVYIAVLVPIQAKVITRDLKVGGGWGGTPQTVFGDDTDEQLSVMELNLENIMMVLMYTSQAGNISVPATANVTVDGGNATFEFIMSNNEVDLVEAPCSWYNLTQADDDLVVSASFADPRGILYVKPGQGNGSDVDSYTEAIPLVAGSHLHAVLSRRQRDIFSNNAQDFFGFAPSRKLILTPVLLLQPDPFASDLGPNGVSLRLRMRNDLDWNSVPEIVQDYSDASVLNGLATLGGFWTFVNGVFVMFFGADLLYFLFKKRPLSALGIVHVFQRRELTRNWNADFPTLRTEGGQPGKDSAGIVAFLRERLVDLDDMDKYIYSEAQNSSSTHRPATEINADRSLESEEMPLLNIPRRPEFRGMRAFTA